MSLEWCETPDGYWELVGTFEVVPPAAVPSLATAREVEALVREGGHEPDRH